MKVITIENRNELKAEIIKAGFALKDVNKELNRRKGTTRTDQNFSATLGNLTHKDFREVLDIIGYEIIIRKKETNE